MRVFRCDHSADFGGKHYERVVLFDRDGVLNVDYGYVFEREKFEWVEGARKAAQELASQGFGVGIITNQSGIGRGYYSEQAFLELMEWVGSVEQFDVAIYCPHAPEAMCPGRKPGSRMLTMALEFFGCEPGQAVFIGDKETDGEAAEAAGVIPVAFDGGDLYQVVLSVVEQIS